MEPLQIALIATILLCALVAGLTFTFATVVMPGLGELSDREYLQGFKAIDGVIQNRQPAFMVVWIGSVIALAATLVLGVQQLAGAELMLLMAAAGIYVFGVQVPTAVVNIPLNNQVQALDLASLDAQALARARSDFEPRWTRWNTIRTILACLAVVLLIVLALRL
ncbi:MAG: DUF1772 domain-containing protein [Acidobacteriota bacterium]